MRLLISVGQGCSFPALTDTDDGWVRVGVVRALPSVVVVAGRLGWRQGTREATRGSKVLMDFVGEMNLSGLEIKQVVDICFHPMCCPLCELRHVCTVCEY